jgi:hypothetical protein
MICHSVDCLKWLCRVMGFTIFVVIVVVAVFDDYIS